MLHLHHWNIPREELKSDKNDDFGERVGQQDSQTGRTKDVTSSKPQSDIGRVKRANPINTSNMKHGIQAPSSQGIKSQASSAPSQVERTSHDTEPPSTTSTYCDPEPPVPSTLLATNQKSSLSDTEQDRARDPFAHEQKPHQQDVRHKNMSASKHKATQSIPSPKKRQQLGTKEIEEPISKSSTEVHNAVPATADQGVNGTRKNVYDFRGFSFQFLGASLACYQKVKRPTWNNAVCIWAGSTRVPTAAVLKNPIGILGFNGAGDVVWKYSWPKLPRLQLKDADQDNWLGHVQIALLKKLEACIVTNQRNVLIHTWFILAS